MRRVWGALWGEDLQSAVELAAAGEASKRTSVPCPYHGPATTGNRECTKDSTALALANVRPHPTLQCSKFTLPRC